MNVERKGCTMVLNRNKAIYKIGMKCTALGEKYKTV